jgi:hypothetical protein
MIVLLRTAEFYRFEFVAMPFVYVLQSSVTGGFYTGSTTNLEGRDELRAILRAKREQTG